jgi:sugar O-acyltransferase (sialic acid O-acetyltransferase NeuD family)
VTRLHILGAGGFAFEVGIICDRLLAAGTAQFTSYDFLDDDPQYASQRGMGHRVSGPIEGAAIDADALYACAIGNPVQRRYVVERFVDKGAQFISLIDPSAVVSDQAVIGAGAIICPHVFVSCFTQLGRHVHLNVASSIGHDAVLGDYVTLSAHVDLTGGVRVGEGAFFGTHAAVLPNHSVGRWARIGAGCTVVRPIKDEAILYTEPPKFLDRGK